LPKKTRGSKLTKGAKIALAALHEAIGECGEVPPASNHIPPTVKCVKVNQWRTYAYKMGISDSEEPRARQQAFKRSHQELVAGEEV
jgi:hypothetical protein